jgi:nucleotide-binding universal stress UspA family protein
VLMKRPLNDLEAATRPRISGRRIGSRPGVQIKRLLVPIDFSGTSLKAIPSALAVARQFRADVYLFHVVDTGQFFSPSLQSLSALMRDEWNDRLVNRLQRIALRYRSGGLVQVLSPREGSAHKEICAAASEMKVDLIVIATHGYTGFRRAALGSTAERVVRHSPCPVLIVRRHLLANHGMARQLTARGLNLKKIVVPTDFSDCSKVAFEYAKELAQAFKAHLQLVHVIDQSKYPFGDEFAAVETARLVREQSRMAQKRLRAMLGKTRGRDSLKVEHGSPATEICSNTGDDVDLIVTSTHGRTGIEYGLIGSVAQHIVRYANCPVLVIPGKTGVRNFCAAKAKPGLSGNN